MMNKQLKRCNKTIKCSYKLWWSNTSLHQQVEHFRLAHSVEIESLEKQYNPVVKGVEVEQNVPNEQNNQEDQLIEAILETKGGRVDPQKRTNALLLKIMFETTYA